MLDEDLADLYGVETRVLVQQVRRNETRFPADFLFQLSTKEFSHLKSQFVMSKWRARRSPQASSGLHRRWSRPGAAEESTGGVQVLEIREVAGPSGGSLHCLEIVAGADPDFRPKDLGLGGS